MGGFFLERITVTGRALADAQLDLQDGLNVISGASDTGKSYLCGLVDYVFGATNVRSIDAAVGYDRVVARLRSRGDRAGYEIERSLGGGDAVWRTVATDGHVLREEKVAAKHSADDPGTLSWKLLSLSGFSATRLRKNKKGDTRSLSFRDIAFLIVVDETRIISEAPPHLSGSFVESTVEGEVLRYLVTGREAALPIVAPQKVSRQVATAQLDLVRQFITRVEDDISALGVDPDVAEQELARLDAARTTLVGSYEAVRLELGEAEAQVARLARDLREVESKLVVNEGLDRRFDLLQRHYQSDIERLLAIREAGEMLDALPVGACPICGAPPDQHRPTEIAAHYELSGVREAATKEREKVVLLLADLGSTRSELQGETRRLSGLRLELREQIQAGRIRIEREIQPKVRTSAEEIQQQGSRRDVLLRAVQLGRQKKDLESRASQLAKVSEPSSRASTARRDITTTAEMEDFVGSVAHVLSAWHVPGADRVVFGENSQDLVIDGHPRASHGKGVRALTCSAFIAGLMRHCSNKGLPHPGLIALDSPLVAYQDPDTPGSEGARIRQAGVKDAFYRSLVDGICPGQFLIFENEDPPADLARRALFHHFSKSTVGRYGFFPA